jgi:hypothetical protein
MRPTPTGQSRRCATLQAAHPAQLVLSGSGEADSKPAGGCVGRPGRAYSPGPLHGYRLWTHHVTHCSSAAPPACVNPLTTLNMATRTALLVVLTRCLSIAIPPSCPGPLPGHVSTFCQDLATCRQRRALRVNCLYAAGHCSCRPRPQRAAQGCGLAKSDRGKRSWPGTIGICTTSCGY